MLNAANEILVEKFLEDKIKFTDIPNNIEKMLNMHNSIKINEIEDILELDNEIRQKTLEIIG